MNLTKRSLTALALAGVALGTVAGAAEADAPRHPVGSATTLSHDVDIPELSVDDLEVLDLLG